MVELARSLDGRLLGDDGEHYDVSAEGVLTIDGEPSGARNAAPELTPSNPPYVFVGVVAALILAAVLWWVRR